MSNEEPQKDLEWYCEMRMGIDETRMLHNIAQQIMSRMKDTAEDTVEYKYLEHLRTKLFAMIMEYNLHKEDQ
tara:strand:+ start:6350 stop:6565 length:216 start_codon:yes stop_codon:yes gene_type:complete